MIRISSNKKRILELMEQWSAGLGGEDSGYTTDDLDGYLVEQDSDCRLMVTKPAPAGEPRHYHSATNTGGRRFVCWAS